MEVELEYLEEYGIIKTIIRGDIHEKDMLEARAQVREFVANRKAHLFLDDLREAKFLSSVIEIYDMPKKAEMGNRLMEGDGYLIKGALLVKQIDDAYKFLDNVFNNRGLKLRIFTDLENAIKWLLEK